MIRILVFLVFVVLIVALMTWMGNLEGSTTITIGDMLINAHSGLVVGLLVIAGIGLVLTTLFISGLVRMPDVIRRKRDTARREKGMLALTRGLESVAAGDASSAQKHARSATRQLEEPGLTRLLTAQAAQLAGDQETAQENFAAMLEAPETAFLGLRGLYLQSMAAGDRKEARGYAERAFQLRPGAEWAYQSVYALNIERAAWGSARDALVQASQHGLEQGDSAKRKEAALLTAQAYAAANAEDHETARKDLAAALKKAPGFTPAAVLAAKLEGAASRRSKAGKILDEAWAIRPHPAIARTLRDLFKDETPERRSERMKKLAERAPNTDESELLIAEEDIALGEFEAARVRLEPLLTRTPRARTFSAMAAAMRGLYGQDAAQYWLDRAAAAPLDPVPGADGTFHFTTDGWRRLIQEFGDHDRLAPPPLDEIQTRLSQDEIKLLTAPPPAPAPEVIVDPEPESEKVDGMPVAEDVSTSSTDETVDEEAASDDTSTAEETEKETTPDNVTASLR